MEIKTIAVIGAGVMGRDIALFFAANNINVILQDVSDNAIEETKEAINNNIRMMKMSNKSFRHLEREVLLSHLTLQTGYENFQDADLVIESVTEDWDIKKNVFLTLDQECRDDVLFASNTSCISITQIAALMPKPERVMGLHFMNPVYMNPVVEAVRGVHTDNSVEEVIVRFLRQWGKTAIVVEDMAGFVANRLSHLLMNEAAFLVQDGIAAPSSIDNIFKLGYSHKMGPLETADLIGLDTVVKSLDVLYQYYQDPKYRCCPHLRRMVDAGLLGRKNKKGFYEYS